MIILWIVTAILFLIIEILTPAFISMWFSIGSVLAIVTSLITDNTIIQFLVFILSSTLMILLFQNKIKKLTEKHYEKVNSDSIIGKTCLVSKTVDNLKGTGMIKINYQEWIAASKNGNIIEEGTRVIIRKIEGVKVIVEEVEEVENQKDTKG